MTLFRTHSYTKRVPLLLLIVFAFTALTCAQAPDNQSDTQWLIEVLDIQKGSIVADIGAGDGDQTVEIAEHIGPQGTIYSTELGADRIEELKEKVQNSSFDNITVLEGHPDKTNLAEQCCDAIFMRRVYHHITNPKAFNNSLFESLKPGGRLGIIDFVPRDSEADPEGRSSGDQHGVTAKTVVEELKKAGFSLVSSDEGSGRDIYVVMQKPNGNP